MKVLLAHNFYRSSSPSGEDAVFNNEKSLLAASGVDIIPYEKHNDDLSDDGLPSKLRIASNTIWSRSAYHEITSLIDETRPDIAHFHNTFPQISPSAYAACRDLGVPVVQTLHNYRLVCPGAMLQRDSKPCELCLHGSLLHSMVHRCYRGSLLATGTLSIMIGTNRILDSYDKVDRYIALTEFAAAKLAEGGLPREKLRVKPNFLPTGPPIHSDRDHAYAVFVGRLSSEKGVKCLLEAWKELDYIPLKVLGDGPMRDELEREADRQSLNISFLGQLSKEEVLYEVSGALVQIVPSEWYEGFPMVILEAYASGTPVIASDIGSLSEVVLDGITGFRFEPGSPRQLSERVKHIHGMKQVDEAGYMKMRNAIREHFEHNFTAEKNLELLLDIYEDAISTARGK